MVVTGLGLLTPVGNNVPTVWNNIQNGVSGIGLVKHFSTADFPVHIGGSVKDFDVTDHLPRKHAKKMNVFIHYGMVAGIEAIEDSGLEVTEDNAHRVGVAIGSGIGGVSEIEHAMEQYLGGDARRISPFLIPGTIINMISGHLSIKYGIQGPNLSMATACSTGTHNIGDAARLIEYGDADVMVAGGAEMATSPTSFGGFAAAKALSTRNNDPQAASRPWDRDRDGFVLSDGAGVMVLEEYEHAKNRGAKIYSELLGYGMSGDAHHMTAPSEGGEGAARCMQNALKNAGLNPEQIDYVNAHGTSTLTGDIVEARAMKRVFGTHARKLAVSSTKSMIGHLLGAAGSVEAIFSVLALRDQVAPPTINLDNPDAECDLDFIPHEARQMEMDISLSNSFGFGGTNGTLIFRRTE